MIKNINKFISIVLILFFIAMPFANAADNGLPDITTWEGAQSIGEAIEETKPVGNIGKDGFGIYIKLVMYDEDTKREEIIGKPILLYNDPLFQNITEVDTSASGNTENSGGITVCFSGDCPPESVSAYDTVWFQQAVAASGGNVAVALWNMVQGMLDANAWEEMPHQNEDGSFTGELNYDPSKPWLTEVGNSCKSTGIVKRNEYISKYNKNNVRFLFDGKVNPKDHERNKKLPGEEGVTLIKSAVNLTSVNSYGYADLYDYINNCILATNYTPTNRIRRCNSDSEILRDNNGSGIVTLNTVLKAFKIDHINMAKMRNYYLSFEPVTREKTETVVSTAFSSKHSVDRLEPGWEWYCSAGCTSNITTNSNRNPGSCQSGCHPATSSKCSVSDYSSKEACQGAGHSWTEGHAAYCDCNGIHYFKGCNPTGYEITRYLFTYTYYKISVIQPARYGGANTSEVNKKIATLSSIRKKQKENEHEIIKEIKHEDGTSENVETGEYEYYIGPTADTAMVVEDKLFGAKNKYHLATQDTPKTIDGAGLNKEFKTTAGVGYWWLLGVTNCKNECGGTGDELLKCAENYCDNAIGYDTRANVQKRKSGCIIDLCGYVYGKDPNGKNNKADYQSVNSCDNADPYKNIATTDNQNSNSLCSVDSATGENYTKGVTTHCYGDNITDFDNDDTNDKIFDRRTYINVACKETSLFSYTDTTRKVYVAGEGIDYYAKLKGERECTVFFNLEQWKFDYATIHSKDEDGRRERLLYIFDRFNNMMNDSYKVTDSEYYNKETYDQYGDDEKPGEFFWSDLLFDDEKTVEVFAKVEEILKNGKTKTSEEKLVKVKGDIETSQNVSLNEKITAMSNLNVKRYDVNKYIQTSNVENYYGFNKYCVSTDGKATVYLAPGNGICYVKNGNYCSPETGASTTSVYGENRFYIDKDAMSNKLFANNTYEHKITTAASVLKRNANGALTDTKYYDNSEVCNYVVNDKKGASCTITITPDAEAVALGNDIYEGGKLSAKVRYYEELDSDDGIASTTISVDGVTYSNPVTLEITDANVARRDFKVEGTVTTKKGENVTCSKTVILHQYTSCGISCGVEKVNDTLYEIKGVGSISEYSTSLSTNMTRRRLQPSVTDNKYYVRISEPLDSTSKEDPTIIFGYVKNNRCENYCRTPKPDLSNCLDEYDPANTGCVKSYCESNYDKDINNYESVEECIQMCSRDRMCPEDRRSLETVRTFCNNEYSGLGYSSSDACINICYYQPDSDANYLYRTINVRNPFPNSADSEAPYKTGPRLVGSNWYGLSKYIKQDDEDSTSVTGSSANSSVEYIIDLTQEDIRRIRDDTNKIKSNHTYDAYTDYIYSADYRESEYVGRYKSKFIHDDFGYLFKKLPD